MTTKVRTALDLGKESDSYFIGNASLGYAPANGVWKIQAYVKNFTDAVVLANASRNYTGGIQTYQFQAPRTFGVRIL